MDQYSKSEESLVALAHWIDDRNGEAKECKGSKYDSPSDGRHLWVHPFLDQPAICYYCSARESEIK